MNNRKGFVLYKDKIAGVIEETPSVGSYFAYTNLNLTYWFRYKYMLIFTCVFLDVNRCFDKIWCCKTCP